MPSKASPFCSNCGYQLEGCTESSKCPECGLPLVEVLSRGGHMGRRYRSKATLFGIPVIDYAFGPRPGEPVGRPRGIIAMGDVPTGVLAIGGVARGVVAAGGVAIGVVTFGGVSLGLLGAAGGLAVGALVWGGLGVGLLASGGLAVGIVASGGVPIGWYSAGGAAFGKYVIGPGSNSAEARSVFRQCWWFFGRGGVLTFFQPLIALASLWLVGAVTAGLMAAWGNFRHERTQKDEGVFGE